MQLQYVACGAIQVLYAFVFNKFNLSFPHSSIFCDIFQNPGISKEELTQRVKDVLNRAQMARLLQVSANDNVFCDDNGISCIFLLHCNSVCVH